MKKLLLSSFLVILTICQLNAQGCSDAGFCTLEGLKPGKSLFETAEKATISVGAGTGLADNSILILNQYLQASYNVSAKVNFDVKFTSLAQLGAEHKGFGLSDVYINANIKLKNNNGLLGLKLPFNMANNTHTKNNNTVVLPMDYQASMGTVDLILGLSRTFGKYSFTAAFQNPLTQNENTFVKNSEFSDFQTTNKYKRASDVMLRAAYNKGTSTKKLSFTPALLAIFHTANDQFTNSSNQLEDIQNSKGLTLNANIFADLKISKTRKMQFSAGVPVVARKNRPDGLTRIIAVNAQYTKSIF
jgi:hypothetical protein